MITIMFDWRHLFDQAPRRTVRMGETLFRQGDPVRYMYLVRSGEVVLERPLAEGSTLTLHVAGAEMPVAEASLFADTYHCDAVARTVSVVSATARTAFVAAVRQDPDAALGLIQTHAMEVQAQRTRIEILRLRRVADRLDAWLALNGAPAHREWIRVADQIGVSPAALYRELARRRRLTGQV
ncbi:MAG: Crp/Fnr family transcriptional regulator [Pseudomonadota bacterium]